jgi:hypothetical protein
MRGGERELVSDCYRTGRARGHGAPWAYRCTASRLGEGRANSSIFAIHTRSSSLTASDRLRHGLRAYHDRAIGIAENAP